MHPDERALQSISSASTHVVLPLVGRRIPIVADEYADPEKGSGAVKITPAHDFNDFEVGKRHPACPSISIFDRRRNFSMPRSRLRPSGVAHESQLTQTIRRCTASTASRTQEDRRAAGGA